MLARTSPSFSARRRRVPASRCASWAPETLIAVVSLVRATDFVLTIFAATEACADGDGGIVIGAGGRE